jgi:hypothetical protein
MVGRTWTVAQGCRLTLIAPFQGLKAQAGGPQDPGQRPGSRSQSPFWQQALKGRNSMVGRTRTVAQGCWVTFIAPFQGLKAQAGGPRDPGQRPGSRSQSPFWQQALKGRNSMVGRTRTVAQGCRVTFIAPFQGLKAQRGELRDPGRWPISVNLKSVVAREPAKRAVPQGGIVRPFGR